MDYQIKYYNRGFSLVELLIVIGILALFATTSTGVYYSLRSNTSLELNTGSVVEAVRLAQSSAQSGKGDAKWGVKISANQLTIFEGNSYAARNTAADQVYTISGDVAVSGIDEVVFEKVSGATTGPGTVTLTNSYGVRNIVINEKGTVTY